MLKEFKLRYEGVLLHFGTGTIEKSKNYLHQFEKVVIVTGRSSAKTSGALDDVERVLKELGVKYVLFNKVSPNPWASQAEELAKVVWEEGADAVIAIGGGSPIDVSKIATIIVANGGKVYDYVRGVKKAKRMIPLIAVNLTHGTGTEVDKWAVVTLDDTREKIGIAARYPDLSIDDPTYTLTLDERQTIYTSLDAFYHSYESATAKTSNPLSQSLAESAIGTIAETLPKLAENLRDLALRYRMLYASMIAGIAIDMARTHIIHAIEHVLSGLEPKLPHGCGLGLLGPRAVYYIHKAAPELSARLLRHINPHIKPTIDSAAEAEKTVAKFQEEIGLRERLSDYGFTERDVANIAERVFTTFREWINTTAPLEVTKDVIIDILKSAL
ncbi:iron-containing alcohol dehydrogenase [Pyrobaculum islandicum DSM 4184]|uniref:Iron-containing alcohol dehydrogenase n=1 Tax=Pyrobaculum islandicum (strain DSM 4184 / JCM 9189 / GEO3) TaxID=384616 RepID=A1RUX3_PYRIL|nr:iron-containing alcohol dehydrogenase [Pyrobaculum islandicum]ABL88755.1 iron-containing alcohol dehydrogenase [Pyrobaculum islandicum DSM 4184]